MKRGFTAIIRCEDNTRVCCESHARARMWRDVVRGISPSVQRAQASCSTFRPGCISPKIDQPSGRVNMPPDSKDLSSLKDKSPSFHRLHATDLDRMKGIYLSAEELRGFDKYKVTPTID